MLKCRVEEPVQGPPVGEVRAGGRQSGLLGSHRRDAQQRHELIHQSTPSLLRLGARACTNCATAKARCSGGSLCLRCQGRSLDCVYPEVRDATSIGQRSTDQNHNASGAALDTGHASQTFQQSMAMAHGIDSDAGVPGPDFWDLNSLTNANWLDGLAESDFADFALLGVPSPLPANTTQGTDSTVWTFSSTSSPHTAGNVFHTSDGPNPQARRRLPPSSTHTDNLLEDVDADEEAMQAGRLYVDGEAARLPRTKRRKLSAVRSGQRKKGGKTFSLAFEKLDDVPSSVKFHVQDSAYAKLEELYNQLCLNPGHLWPSFEQVELPSVVIFEYLLQLYFENFDRVLPCVDCVELTNSPDCPFSVLGMAAAGSFYMEETSTILTFAVSMQEFVRRVLQYQRDTDNSQVTVNTLGRIRILHLVGLAYCGDARLGRYAIEQGHVLRETFTNATQDILSQPARSADDQDATIEERWKAWRFRENAVRLACTAWLVDCMRQYHFDVPATLGNPDIALPLPSHEKLWNARSPQEWMDIGRDLPTATQDLREALSEIYVDKRLSRGTGEFARIIIIHGLFHRLWEVERYFSDPLSSWEPIAQRQASSDVLPRPPIWLPAITAFTKWQNSTCDALDILHWQANATIGQASGFEHPTVLHLHVARLVLLAPLKNIINFVRAKAAGSTAQTSDREIIRRWAIHHQYKARLSIVHAGVVFWHVRRYSTNGFYEAPAVALAALTLWAFGTFAGGKRIPSLDSTASTHDQSPRPGAAQANEDSECMIILIDRPTDDELVQHFIKHGSTMRIHISGVGDLYGSKGPQRALLQGCRLLGTLKCWGINETWLELLNTVASGYEA
nr:hypothetical protein CFP56_68683 [Quercus suber]